MFYLNRQRMRHRMQICNRSDACHVLGVSVNAGLKDCKKAYHEICLRYHPDVWAAKDKTFQQRAEEYFKLASQAYDYLLQEESARTASPVNSGIRIYGQNGSFTGHASYLRRQEADRKRREEQKKKKLEELKLKSRQLQEEQQKKKEEEILNQLRWLRVARLIQETIEQDKKMKRTDLQ